jgi:hypothetical protein
MKALRIVVWSSALSLGLLPGLGEETNQVEALKRQIGQLQENLDRFEREQRAQIEALTRKLEELTGTPAPRSAATDSKSAERKKLEQELAAQLGAAAATNAPPSAAPPVSPEWSPSQPLTVMRAGSAYMNVSFDALADAGWSTAHDPSAQLQLGDHDPVQRGFSLRNAEIALDGAVDPYFKGFANIVFKLDHNNETEVELEETYLQSTALPANLQLKAGQFFAGFGRQNTQHPHQWAFVDEPLILSRAFGPEGLRSVGAQLSWLLPTSFYTEGFLGVFNGQGGTAFSFRNPGEPDALGVNRFHGRATSDRELRGAGDLLYVPRIASSFDLTDSQTLLVGASAAFGPNDTGPHSRTQIYGVDAYWKWKPTTAQHGFPFVSWQTEGMYRVFDAGEDPAAGLPAETLRDWGFYSQVLWGFRQRWVAGLRGEYVTGNNGAFDSLDVFRNDRTRVAPNLTFYPSEFSKIRLQYNYDHGQLFGDAHSVWMQFEFLLGAHGAHKF